jgi:hypothetical protein
MKKILLATTFSIFAVTATFAQTGNYPCINPAVKIDANNGGGTCGEITGYTKSGTITITFDFPPSEMPEIVSIIDNGTGLAIPGVKFVFDVKDTKQGNVIATYCYYNPGNEKLKLNNGKNDYRFVLSYSGRGAVGCDDFSNAPLPVKLKSFTASRNKTAVGLTWVTATEQNNRGFELQRMIGNGEWATIAFIFSQADDGNSDVDLPYSYNDHNSYQGVSQYRLMQVDLNDRINYSDVRSVRGVEQSNKTIVTPNPSSNGNVNVLFEDIKGQRDLLLFDAMGRVVKQWNNYADNSLQIAGLKTGFYQLSIINKATGVRSVEKIVVAGK